MVANEEVKWTPGPWTYSGDEDGDFVVWSSEGCLGNIGGAPFAPVYSDPKNEMVAFDLEQANAQLIAAAPELYAGLMHQIYRNHPCTENCDGCRKSIAALRSARGEE